MQIVIDIPEEIYNHIVKSGILCENELFQSLLLGVRYGTPLPKGHGDLVDISKLYDQKIEQWNPFVEFLGEEYVSTGAIETYATVVIPADKE